MKKVIGILLLVVISASSFSQQTTKPAPKTQSDYLAKAKKQNATAWILLGGGFASSTAGIIINTQKVKNEIINLFDSGEAKDYTAGNIMLIAGAVTMLGSIPFFVASSENKKKAADAPISFKLKMETQSLIRQGSIIKTSYPAISLRVSF